MNPSSATVAPAFSQAAPRTQPARGERLVSLDAFRGFTMFWLMGGKSFVVAVAVLAGFDAVTHQLTHSPWEGVRYYDIIWPSFMLMVGVAIPFSFAKRTVEGTHGEMMRHCWRRTVVLFLLGSLRESIHDGVPRLIELSSALQPIAVAYLVCCYLADRSWRAQAIVAIGILAGYALLLALVPAPGVAAGTYEINRNLVTAVDQRVLGRAHKDGWGTVLTTVPTIATTLIGLLLGRVLLSGAAAVRKLKIVALCGIGCLGAGWALSPVVPPIMKLWTTSYGLISAGWACLLLALFFWIVDLRGWRRPAFPLLVIGANALAAYMLPTFVPLRKTVAIFSEPLAKSFGVPVAVLTTGMVLVAGWLILFCLYRRKIFLRG